VTNAGQATRGNDLYLINLVCDYTILIALIELLIQYLFLVLIRFIVSGTLAV